MNCCFCHADMTESFLADKAVKFGKNVVCGECSKVAGLVFRVSDEGTRVSVVQEVEGIPGKRKAS